MHGLCKPNYHSYSITRDCKSGKMPRGTHCGFIAVRQRSVPWIPPNALILNLSGVIMKPDIKRHAGDRVQPFSFQRAAARCEAAGGRRTGQSPRNRSVPCSAQAMARRFPPLWDKSEFSAAGAPGEAGLKVQAPPLCGKMRLKPALAAGISAGRRINRGGTAKRICSSLKEQVRYIIRELRIGN